MADLLFAAGALLLLVAALGLAALWRTRAVADLMLAVQLLGSAGVAVLLMLAVASRDAAILDVALALALLAAFAAAAFRAYGSGGTGGDASAGRRP